jgi:two-component system, chemotaxis family, response regulator Rcp1
MQIALTECKDVTTHLSILNQPEHIVEYMYGRGKYSDAKRPDLIILDYHMPLDGGKALAALKGSPDLQCVPILVLTGVADPSEVDDLYRRHANACFLRGSDLDASMQLACNIVHHWCRDVLLPPPLPHDHRS